MDLNEARQTADKLSVDLVSGVEISAFWRNMTIHIIGLDIDINNDILQAGLVHNQQLRKERARKNSTWTLARRYQRCLRENTSP